VYKLANSVNHLSDKKRNLTRLTQWISGLIAAGIYHYVFQEPDSDVRLTELFPWYSVFTLFFCGLKP